MKKVLKKGEEFAKRYEWWHQNGCSDTFIGNFGLILLFSKAFPADLEKPLVSWVKEKNLSEH